MRTITTCLWFDGDAEAAAELYTGLLPGSRIAGTPTRYPEGSPQAGAVMTVPFELMGRPFVGLNGGPKFSFTEAISFQVPCADQEEVDRYWAALTEGGAEQPCGWCKDRFGISWQIIPTRLTELLASSKPGVAERVGGALMGMKKVDIAALEAAAAGDHAVDPAVFSPMGGDGS